MNHLRQIFLIVAGGNAEAERHFEDTIKNKRNLTEVKQFLAPSEINNLENIYHSTPFIVWGSVPGPLNVTRWSKMKAGDIVLVVNRGRVKYVGEIATTVRSRELAKYFWRENPEGSTWELMYFVVNEEKVDVPLSKINPYFGYSESYSPRGFSMINDEAVEKFARNYGDILGVLKTLEKGETLVRIVEVKEDHNKIIAENIEKAPTEHTEMQWRLIRLGKAANLDIWVPANNQNLQYKGNKFKDYVLPEFHETLDVPPTIKNIDVVWKFGPYSIKSAFEIENSTAVYSGILRMADLRAENPNSNYPLFIVAPEEKRNRVFNEIKRPAFSERALKLNEVVRYLGYDAIRAVDDENKDTKIFDPSMLFSKAESAV